MRTLLFILLLLIAIPKTSTCQTVNTTILNSCVLVEVGNSSGTGFIYTDEKYIYLITARHVFVNPEDNSIYGNIARITTVSGEENETETSLMVDMNKVVESKTANVSVDMTDVFVLALGKVTDVDTIKQTSRTAFFGSVTITVPPNLMLTSRYNAKLMKEVKLTDEAYMLGYPKSLINHRFAITRPLISKGIVSGKDYNAKLIVVDCPAHKGNSGGPVYFTNIAGNIFFIGIVVEYLADENQVYDLSQKKVSTAIAAYGNSGFAIVESMDNILPIIANVRRNLP